MFFGSIDTDIGSMAAAATLLFAPVDHFFPGIVYACENVCERVCVWPHLQSINIHFGLERIPHLNHCRWFTKFSASANIANV